MAIVVFAAFMLGDFVIVKILGLALGVAVMVDATFVRIAIGPALFRLAGRHNWWPGEELHLNASIVQQPLGLQRTVCVVDDCPPAGKVESCTG